MLVLSEIQSDIDLFDIGRLSNHPGVFVFQVNRFVFRYGWFILTVGRLHFNLKIGQNQVGFGVGKVEIGWRMVIIDMVRHLRDLSEVAGL